MEHILTIDKLCVCVKDKEIIKDLSLQIKPGEVHAIMGPNGAGKSTLANVLAGREEYQVTQGKITYCQANLLSLSPEERAWRGLFMSFQYPVAIPGLSNIQFLKAALNAKRLFLKLAPLDALDFIQLVKDKMQALNMNEKLLYRALNDGFSGGEKKSNEILQMSLLEPKLAILDETDSGLDIDALRMVAAGVNALRSPDRAILLITHYQRLLDYIEPDRVHVMAKGQIVHSGDKSLPHVLEEKGYNWLTHETAHG